jgi:hypothetical protein
LEKNKGVKLNNKAKVVSPNYKSNIDHTKKPNYVQNYNKGNKLKAKYLKKGNKNNPNPNYKGNNYDPNFKTKGKKKIKRIKLVVGKDLKHKGFLDDEIKIQSKKLLLNKFYLEYLTVNNDIDNLVRVGLMYYLADYFNISNYKNKWQNNHRYGDLRGELIDKMLESKEKKWAIVLKYIM